MDSMVQSESMGAAIESAIITQSNISMTQSKLITKGQSRKKQQNVGKSYGASFTGSIIESFSSHEDTSRMTEEEKKTYLE